MALYGSNLSHVDQILYYFNGRNVHGLLWPKPPYPPSFHEFIATPASLQFPDFASGSLVSEYGAGKYQIAVEIPEGISNKLDLTIVQNPNVPTISSISPNSMASADLGAPITIYGSNLLNTPQVIFSDGDGHGFSFAASSQQMLQNTSNKMIIRLDSYKDYLTYGNPVGKYQVTVDTPDGTSNKLNFEVK